VPVPLYETSSAEQVLWILTNSEVSLLVAESAAHAATAAEVRVGGPSVREVLVIDDGAIAMLVEAGRGVPDSEIARRRGLARLDDLATIIYTSGTTGRPKGTELTHGNFSVLTRNAVGRLGEVVNSPGSRTLVFMPLAHVFARFVEVLCIPGGAVLGHTSDTKNLVADLGSFKPTFILSVPRVFEKVYNSAEQKAASGTAAGKNVAPAVPENRLRSHPFISQVVVVGDARPFIGALVTIDPEGLPGWLATHGHAHLTLEEARTSPAVLESIAKAVERANRAVSRAESIRKFRILPGDLTIANGYLTPKLSIRRTEVIKDLAAEIDALYETSDAHSD
jgi:long-subunit acyl-CoA synthetase (AMP-forming)